MPRKPKSSFPPEEGPTKPSNMTAMMYHSLLRTFDSMSYDQRADFVDLMFEYSKLDKSSCRSVVEVLRALSSVPGPDRPDLLGLMVRYISSSAKGR